MLPLFAYGTLRDPEYQRELFGRTYPMRPARALDFLVVSTGGGYLTAIPQPGAAIAGALVELDAPGYAVADAWEDRSVYDRVEVAALGDGGRLERCFLYVSARSGAAGAPVEDGRLADRPRAEIIADIRHFRASSQPHAP